MTAGDLSKAISSQVRLLLIYTVRLSADSLSSSNAQMIFYSYCAKEMTFYAVYTVTLPNDFSLRCSGRTSYADRVCFLYPLFGSRRCVLDYGLYDCHVIRKRVLFLSPGKLMRTFCHLNIHTIIFDYFHSSERRTLLDQSDYLPRNVAGLSLVNIFVFASNTFSHHLLFVQDS